MNQGANVILEAILKQTHTSDYGVTFIQYH